MTLLLTHDDIVRLLTIDDCLTAVEDAFRGFGEGRIAPPQSLGLHADDGTFHIKAAMTDVVAVKINANFPRNAERHGLPTIQGVIVVMDRERGTPLAIMDSAWITTLRTAAATAVAAKYLAREDTTTMTIIGCGVQGRAHVEALRRVRNIETLYACDRDPEAARSTGGIVAEIDEAVAQSDIVVTCTTSRAPILHARHLRPGLFIAGVGADNPEKHELAPELLAGAKVVPDLLDQAAKMGDLHHALAAGALARGDVHGELADVLCGKVAGRRSDDEVFVFDSTGTALQDVVVAAVVYRRASTSST